MHVRNCLQLLTFFSALAPNDVYCCPVSCTSISLTAWPGSEVLLPCSLSKSNETEEARWSQSSTILSIRPDGNVTFEDPKDGRMTVFPSLFSRGNFSVLFRQIRTSDMGIYCCRLTHECQRVVIEPLENSEGHEEGWSFLWYYIAGGVGAFILLLTALCLICIFRGKCFKKLSDSYYVNSECEEKRGRIESSKVDECEGEYEDIESEVQEVDYENSPGAERQDEDTESDEQDEDYVNTDKRNDYYQHDSTENKNAAELHVDVHMQGQQARKSIYENDEHSPNQRSEQNTDAGVAAVFRKMPNQQPNTGLYYANQSEINKSARPRNRTKAKEEYQFKNPLYGRTPAPSK